MKTIRQILAVTLLAFSQVFGQTALNFHVDYDNAIGGSDAVSYGSNYGSAIQNATYTIPPNFKGQLPNRNRALLHFDLSPVITFGGVVLSAELRLSALGPSNGYAGHFGTNDSYIRRVTSSWNPQTVSWNSQPSTTTAGQAYLPQSTSPTQDYFVDVTEMVRAMIVNYPANNHGFMLMLNDINLNGGLLFGSEDNTDPQTRPRLTVKMCTNTMIRYADIDAAIGMHDGLNASGNNYGGATQNAAYCVQASNYTFSGNKNRALMRFDLPNLPTNAVISSARLNLYAHSTGPTNGHFGTANATDVLRVTSNWDEYQVTWDNQPSTGSVVATLPQSTTNDQDYLNIDVTQAVQDMIANPSTNYGFMLKLVSEYQSNGLVFKSSDMPTQHPKLIIELDCFDQPGKQNEGTNSVALTIYPNPTNGSLSLNFELFQASSTTIQLFDMQGRALSRYDAFLGSVGAHTLNLDALIADQPAGIYILRAKIGEQVTDRKLVLTGN